MKALIYSLLLLTAALLSHSAAIHLPDNASASYPVGDWISPAAMVGLGVVWGYTTRPREVTQ